MPNGAIASTMLSAIILMVMWWIWFFIFDHVQHSRILTLIWLVLSENIWQWLDIALSTISKPDLVFLDEPTAGLSVDETRITGEIVKNLNKQGITFVVVGHDMDFVKQTATKVSVLHLGKMFIEGSVDKVLSDKGVNDVYLGLS